MGVAVAYTDGNDQAGSESAQSETEMNGEGKHDEKLEEVVKKDTEGPAQQFNPFDDSEQFDIEFKTKSFSPPENWEEVQLKGVTDEYSCYLPPAKNSDAPKAEVKSIAKELHPLWRLDDLLDTCLTFVEGYWTYEFCRRKSTLTQYHEEVALDEKGAVKGQIRSAEYILGKRQVNATSGKAPTMAIRSGELSPGETGVMDRGSELIVPFYVERFVDGTVCDLTGNPREVDVRYICNEAYDKKGSSYILNFKEQSTCKYLVVVETGIVCKHPILRSAVKEPNTHTILCKAAAGEDESTVGFDLDALDVEAFDLVSLQKLKMQRYSDKTANVEGNPQVKDKGEESEGKGPIVTSTGFVRPRKAKTHIMFRMDKNLERKKYVSDEEFIVDRGGFIKEFYSTRIEGYSYKGGKLNFCIKWQAADIWVYEYCHLRHLTQSRAHSDQGFEEVTTIQVGKFVKEKHDAWANSLSEELRSELEGDNHMTYRFTEGEMCADNIMREAIVVTRCSPFLRKSSPEEMYTLVEEPRQCNYFLVVMSSAFCDI
eukprot:Nk52_evm27s158 gene=Nk52_evmTU27s158